MPAVPSTTREREQKAREREREGERGPGWVVGWGRRLDRGPDWHWHWDVGMGLGEPGGVGGLWMEVDGIVDDPTRERKTGGTRARSSTAREDQ